MNQKIGVIGGSGLYEMAHLEKLRSRQLTTPFGEPSAAYVEGRLQGVDVAFLARHGVGHRLLPAEINHRANIYGFKQLGATRIVSLAAVGSLREEMAPRDIVMIDQFVDRTKRGLEQTFFGHGIVGHIPFGDPICPDLQRTIHQVADQHLKGEDPGPAGRPPRAHLGGTYVNMEGPAFSTRAESNLYRSWGMDVIGMTNLAEAKLAREAEICYCTMALVTDYDCWHQVHGDIKVESLLAILRENIVAAQAILQNAIPRLAELPACECGHALQHAILTEASVFPKTTRERMGILLDKYYPGH